MDLSQEELVSSSPQVTAGRGRGTAPKVGGRGQPRQPPPAAAGRGQPPAQMAMPELQEISQSKESQLRLQLVQQHQLFQQQQHNQQEQEQKQQQQLVGQQQPPQQQQEQEQKQQPQFVGLPEQQPQQQPPFPLQHTPPTVGRGAPLPHLVPQEQQQPAPLAVGRGAPLAAPPAVAASRVPTGSRAAESNKSEMWVCPNCHSLSSVSIPVCASCQTSIDAATKTGASLDDAYTGLPTELADRARKGGKGKGGGFAGNDNNRGDANVRTTVQGNVAVQEWVNPKFQKEKKPTLQGKEAQLLELKNKLAAAEKKKEIMNTAGDTKKVDESDGGAYTFTEFLTFYPKEVEAVKKWETAPTMGKWGLWGCEVPSNVPTDEFLDCCIEEAESMLTTFKSKRKEYLEKKRKYEISQQEIEDAKEETRLAQEEVQKKEAAMQAQRAEMEELMKKMAELQKLQQPGSST